VFYRSSNVFHISHALNQRTCFNCGEAGHNVSDCPLPHDKRQIAKRRREFADENIRTKRIHECIETKLKVDSFKPGVLSRSLQDALDITMPPDEPPYYAQMRYHGYPPGYLGFAYEKEETPLKTYENEQDYKQAEEMIENQNKDTLIELVEYSGLQFINTSQLEKHLNQGYSQLQQEQELQRQEQDWEYYYYEYSMNAQTDYPPGTLQTEYPPPETIQSVYLPPETVQTYSSFRNIETINQSVTVPDTVTCSIHTVDTLIEDNQSVDMEISSDDEE
jgi:hypothetical protein